MHPTVAANHYHRTDLNWTRVGKSRYENYDGWTITKDHNRHCWILTTSDGTTIDSVWPTLIAAKYEAARLGA